MVYCIIILLDLGSIIPYIQQITKVLVPAHMRMVLRTMYIQYSVIPGVQHLYNTCTYPLQGPWVKSIE